ncbi:hypothetical protein KFL_007580040 [Klebsormidium nitens]|uniref:Secreted protein n=1 Tax=Klebsormidium nitens TaxID=105231 RepID=A0A1Y1IRA8_KLENI|nr:hypothetical protein KFL_007580040 [Klebsormidium nitens]|eukprot:GAQ91286.1 hypothetical protein KFL_007580040 [Klebsormidium nitens]
MKKAPALQTVRTIAILVALASLGAPASAARTLQQVQTTPVSSTQKPASLIFETASPTARPGVGILGGTASQLPTLHACPTETGFLPLATRTEAGATRCAKTYPRAEMWGAVLIPGYNTDDTRTEAFALEMEPNHQLNGAILSSCYQRISGGNRRRRHGRCHVFDVSWTLPVPEYDYKSMWTLEMIVRAETDTKVVKFGTYWSLWQEPYLLYYVEDVSIANKE